MAEISKISDIQTNKLLIKNLPFDLSSLNNLLCDMKLSPTSIENFGRKRALLAYRTTELAQNALAQLMDTKIKDKPLKVSAFGGNGVSKSKKQPIEKTTQKVVSESKSKQPVNVDAAATDADISKQLGLVETVYVDDPQEEDTSNSSNNTSKTKTKRKRKKQMTTQPYDYVIAVDFEATCWENQAPPQWRESEIIEFPAVLVNMKTGKVEAEFHKYVLPFESPRLSAFCVEFTGITQKTVDDGIPLQKTLMMFHEWLRNELRSRALTLPKMSKDNKRGNCAFVTWTDWDFGICLDKECKRKSIKKYPYFNQWIDARALYRQFYKYRPLNFSDALNNVGLTFSGRQHSGIDDAKNLGALTYKMVHDGVPLAITKDLTPFEFYSNCLPL